VTTHIAAGSQRGIRGRRTQSLRWRPAVLTARLATVALIGLGIAIALGRPALALIAAPSLVALLPVLQWGVRPAELQMTLSVSEERCFEGDDLEVVLEVKSRQVLGMIAARYGGVGAAVGHQRSDAAFDVEPALVAPVHATNTAVFRWTVTPRRWGNWVLGDVQVQVRSRGLGWGSRASVSLPGLKVFPPKINARDLVVPADVLSRIGSHTGRRPGAGMEFIGTRDYVPGDSVRHINWPASSRRQNLVVNQHAAERATEVVVLVDTTGDGALANGSILETAVRVSAGIAQAYLDQGDRVGVVGFGARIRWLAPDLGVRQYYRIMDQALASVVAHSYVRPEITRLPRTALPSGAMVFVVSPLLEPAVLDSVADLRSRGHATLVIDLVATFIPPSAHASGPLGQRIWRLDRAATLHAMRELGVAVIPWREGQGVSLERRHLRLQPGMSR
jgi:uncharacterized protein (DUF58 family)